MARAYFSAFAFSPFLALGCCLLNTWSSQDIQISSLNEFLSCPLSNHPCSKFSSSPGLAINSEPRVLWNDILLFLSCSNVHFAVYCFHKFCLCFPTLGFSTLQMALPIAKKMEKTVSFGWTWLNDLLLSLVLKTTQPQLHIGEGIWWHSDCVRSIRIPVMCLDRFPNCHTNILKVIYSCVRSDMSKAHCRKRQESIVQHNRIWDCSALCWQTGRLSQDHTSAALQVLPSTPCCHSKLSLGLPMRCYITYPVLEFCSSKTDVSLFWSWQTNGIRQRRATRGKVFHKKGTATSTNV